MNKYSIEKKKSLAAVLLSCLCITSKAGDTVKDSLEFDKAFSQSPAELISGRISGIQVESLDGNPVGATMSYIRGLNTLRSDSQPLWIVDGAMLSGCLNDNSRAFWQKGGYTTKGDAIPDYSEQSFSANVNPFSFINPYEIESIEVIKDVSAAALYGSQGANGVIIINTKQAKKEGRDIWWRSNVAGSFPYGQYEGFCPGVSQNHTVGIRESINNTSYNVSAFFRNINSTAKNNGSNYGGVNVGFHSYTSSIVQVDFNTILSMGEQHLIAGTAYFGQPSYTMLSIYPDLFPGNTLEGWATDYDDKIKDYRAVASAAVNINFTPRLSLKAEFGFDFEGKQRGIWYGNGTSFGLVNNGAASVMSSTLFNYNAKLYLNYSTFFAKDHQFSADLSFDTVGYRNKYGVMNGTSFELPYLRADGIQSAGSRADPYKITKDYDISGAIADLRYDYRGICGINAMCRLDFSWKYSGWNPICYPSADAFFDIHKLFMEGIKSVSGLKIEGGWGMAGRESYVPYEFVPDYLTVYPSVAKGSEVYHDGLDRVVSKEWNIGIKAGFINDRISLSAKYYNKTTDEVFSIYCFGRQSGGYWVSSSNGQEIFRNSAGLSNEGVELDLQAIPIVNKDLKWTIGCCFTYNNNLVQAVEYDDVVGPKVGSGLQATGNAIGSSVSSLTGYVEDTDGNYMDLNSDGVITTADCVLLGSSVPKYYGGLESALVWKDFSFEVLFDGAAGNKIANLSRLYGDGKDKLSSSYVEDGDFFRLSRLSVGYDIPIKAKWIRNLKLNLSGMNLFTVTKYSGWNCQVNSYGNYARTFGLDYGSFPSFRSVVFGISANF